MGWQLYYYSNLKSTSDLKMEMYILRIPLEERDTKIEGLNGIDLMHLRVRQVNPSQGKAINYVIELG